MRRHVCFTLLSAVAANGFANSFVPLDLGDYNFDYRNLAGAASQFPVGANTLGGVDFLMPISGGTGWASANDADRILTLGGLNIAQADKVHVLVNTFWGSTGRTATMTVKGDGGTVVTKTLYGGSDMRDYLFGAYTNTINGTTTVNVFNAGSGYGNAVRFDMLTLDLGAEFQTENLVEVEFVDNGANGVSRMFTAGVTVEAVPEPGSLAALALGAAALRRRRR